MRTAPRTTGSDRNVGQDWIEGDPTNNGGYGGGAPSFSDLQQAGRARPPAMTAIAAAAGRPVPATGSDGGGGTVPGAYAPPRLTVPATANDAGGGQVPYTSSPAGVGDAPPIGGVPTLASGGSGESDFEKQLRERYQSSATAPQFAQTASQFVPGANPFTGQNTTTQALNPQLLSSVMDFLKNPSGYTTDAATSTYNRLGGAIDDQFNVDNQKIDEDMARRGIPVSTIAGGRLFDSNVARKSAKEDLAGRILTDQASTLGSDRARAIGAASGLSADEYNRELGTYNTNTAENQRGFNDALASFQTNRASDAQTFGEGEQKLNDYLGFGQQGFTNQLASQNANNAQQQQMIDMLMKLFGGTGGGGTA